MVESASITTNTTEAFTFQISCSFSFSPWYFLSFECSFTLMLISLRTATFITMPFRFVDYHNVWLDSHHYFISLNLEVPQGFSLSFSNTLWRCLSFWLRASSQYIVQMFLYATLATWWWYSMYAVHACILHPTVMCCTVSGASLHRLFLASFLVW